MKGNFDRGRSALLKIRTASTQTIPPQYSYAVLRDEEYEPSVHVDAGVMKNQKRMPIDGVVYRSEWNPKRRFVLQRMFPFLKQGDSITTTDIDIGVPVYYYMRAPEYIRETLEPMLRYLGAGRWPLNYTLHDLGSHYPNATGHDDGIAEPMPVEECGNLLILIYMYEKATGKTDLRFTYSILLQHYTEYLVENDLYPSSQLSTDDGAGEEANQTSVAIKAAIALNADGVMIGQQSFSDTGKHFAQVLYDERVGVDAKKTHFMLVHNDEDSWALQFNLYMDVPLDLRTFPMSALRMQTDFYATKHDEAGVALDNRVNWSKTDWMLFAAATAMAPEVENKGIRDMFIDDIHGFITNGKNDVPFGDRYVVQVTMWWKQAPGARTGQGRL